MKENSYITIQAWMRNELQLKGNDLLVYAIIYGFSQDGESKFEGSLQYLADWCGCTRQGIKKNVNHLIQLDLIQESQTKKNNKVVHQYSCRQVNIVTGSGKHSYPDGKHSLPDNIVDNKEEKRNTFSKEKVEPLVKKKNIYQKCSDEITLKRFPLELDKIVREYLSLRLKMTDKQIYSTAQWRTIINKLEKLAPGNIKEQIVIVEQSIEKGYASFFPVNSSKTTRRKKSYDKDVSCEQYTEEEKDEIRKWQKGVIASGGRIKF